MVAEQNGNECAVETGETSRWAVTGSLLYLPTQQTHTILGENLHISQVWVAVGGDEEKAF